MKARDVAGVQWTPFCYDRGGSRDLELRATAGLEVKKSDSFLESLFFNMKARDGTRTRGPNLGKVVLYQLSHSRIYLVSISLTDTRYIIHTETVLVNSLFHFLTSSRVHSRYAFTIRPKSGFKEAPPISPPSISGFAKSSAAFLAFIEPPY